MTIADLEEEWEALDDLDVPNPVCAQYESEPSPGRLPYACSRPWGHRGPLHAATIPAVIPADSDQLQVGANLILAVWAS